MQTTRPARLFLALLAAALIATTAVVPAAVAAGPDAGARHEQRNYDARIAYDIGAAVAPIAVETKALSGLRAQIPSLAVTYDPRSGVTRSMYNRVGYLTPPRPGVPAETVAMDFVHGQARALGLEAADLASYEITDRVYTAATGASRYYMRQTYDGLPVYNGQMQVGVNREGRVLGIANAFVPGLDRAAGSRRPKIGAAKAVALAFEHLGRQVPAPAVLARGGGRTKPTVLDHQGLSFEPIEASLMWLPVRAGEARLVWNFQIATLDSQHWYDFTVDARDGQVWTRFDWVASDSYRVYAEPAESPNHTTPLPPADGRVVVSNPADPTASPSGWFDAGVTIMDGNNVHACADANANNACDTPEPSCGASQNCDFPINLSSAPSNSLSAAIANLFYWNNLIHDVQYQYGFDEAGGNFQENNFGKGGAGSDSVNADAQDGSGNCNANFGTPTDGSNPRMQMFTCNNTSPARDGDYDNGVIVHEYGHGISNRQVGGPGNSSCLNNNQQAGEGWSDFFALAYTAEVGDQGTDKRGIGTYLFGQAPDGDGIRPQPYSTDPAINNYTYASMSGLSIPHGVGSVWAQVAWEVYWALVDQYGFDPDLYNVSAGAGNHRAMLYVNEGLKNTACSPTFVDNRDGMIQAAVDNFGGADVCLLWGVFADYGLGTDAISGGSNSTNPTNGFALPPECQCSPQAIADAGPDQTICLGESATVGTPAQPSHTYSWSPGGQTTAQINVSPSVTTDYTVTATTSCGSAQDTARITVDDGTGAGLSEDFEGSTAGWTATGLWHQVSNSTCASPANGYNSPTNAFYYGQDSTCDYNAGTNSGSLTSPTITGIDSSSTLTFQYFRQVESFSGDFDRTRAEIISGGGTPTTVFSLNSSNASTLAWVSSGSISLASFAGQAIQVRFVFDTVDNVDNDQIGWFVDDVVVTGTSTCTPGNTAPSVTITAPADGSSFTEGTSVSFAGTATDAEDGTLTGSLSWTSSLDGTIGSGGSFSTSSLSVGTHTITASVTDSGGLSGSDQITVTINAVGGCTSGPGCVDWTVTGTVSYSNQDASANVTVENADTIFLQDNTWRRTTQTYNVTANTVIEFDFQSTVQGEIHGIGFDEDDTLTNNTRIFQLHGTQNWGGAFHDFDNYSGTGFVSYSIPVGQFYTGAAMRLVLVNDNDAGSGNNSRFRNVRIFEAAPPTCSVDVDFESGATGWVNGASATCSTGAFVLGAPTQQTSTVVTQVGGDHTPAPGTQAVFTATNTSAGVNDVDGGMCVLESPTWSVSAASTLSVWYFHGQRDTGDDPSGDFFRLQVSTNGGASYSNVVNIGDVRTVAAWTNATAQIPAGSSVKLRIQVSDGAGPGDIIEGGLDDVTICDN